MGSSLGNLGDCTKLQEGRLCPLLRVLSKAYIGPPAESCACTRHMLKDSCFKKCLGPVDVNAKGR